jgi:hypothetical protein
MARSWRPPADCSIFGGRRRAGRPAVTESSLDGLPSAARWFGPARARGGRWFGREIGRPLVTRSFVRSGFVASLAVAALIGACGGGRGSAGALGAVNVALELGGGATVTGASYTIRRAGGFNQSGNLGLGPGASASTAVGGLPAGDGYAIAISATASDGATGCGGSASFSARAGLTSAVTVHLTCRQAPVNGSVSFKGNLNLCPNLQGVGANLAEVTVGNGIALSVGADDPDSGPSPLAYHWTVSSGALDDAASPRPTFTCLSPGTVTITVAVSDGDPEPDCAPSGSVRITCAAAPPST